MTKTVDSNAPVTRSDVEGIVGAAVHELISVLSPPVEKLQSDLTELQVDVRGLKTSVNRIEHKLDATVDKVDDHEVRIKRLEHETA